jgi:hypothetical protein
MQPKREKDEEKETKRGKEKEGREGERETMIALKHQSSVCFSLLSLSNVKTVFFKCDSPFKLLVASLPVNNFDRKKV